MKSQLRNRLIDNIQNKCRHHTNSLKVQTMEFVYKHIELKNLHIILKGHAYDFDQNYFSDFNLNNASVWHF